MTIESSKAHEIDVESKAVKSPTPLELYESVDVPSTVVSSGKSPGTYTVIKRQVLTGQSTYRGEVNGKIIFKDKSHDSAEAAKHELIAFMANIGVHVTTAEIKLVSDV